MSVADSPTVAPNVASTILLPVKHTAAQAGSERENPPPATPPEANKPPPIHSTHEGNVLQSDYQEERSKK